MEKLEDKDAPAPEQQLSQEDGSPEGKVSG